MLKQNVEKASESRELIIPTSRNVVTSDEEPCVMMCCFFHFPYYSLTGRQIRIYKNLSEKITETMDARKNINQVIGSDSAVDSLFYHDRLLRTVRLSHYLLIS